MERGILMEVRGAHGVLLTRTGEFKSVALPLGSWQVGDEIATRVAPVGRRWLRPVVAAAAAVLVIVGLPTGYWQWSLLQPSVVLAMEINPSLEFTINGKGNVTSARGLNPDGEAVLQAIQWKNQHIDQVVKAATEKAVAMGKLDPTSSDGAIVITVAPAKGEKLPDDQAEAITAAAQTAAQATVKTAAEARGQEPQAQVKAVPTTATEVAEAKAAGMTPPEYVFYKHAQESHPDLNLPPEAFQHKGPGAAIKEFGLDLSDVFPSSSQGRGQDDPSSHDQNDDRKKPTSGQSQNESSGPKKTEDAGQKANAILDSLFGHWGRGNSDTSGSSSGNEGSGSKSNQSSGGQQLLEDRFGLNLGSGKQNNSGSGDDKSRSGNDDNRSGNDNSRGGNDNSRSGDDKKGPGGDTKNAGDKGAGASQGGSNNKGAGDNKGAGGSNGGDSKGRSDSKGSDNNKGRDDGGSGKDRSGKDH